MRKQRLCPCGAPRAASQHVCEACHAAYMRNYRQDHPMNDEQRRKDIARSKVSVYLRRGKLHKSPCPCCGSLQVKARILNYEDPVHSVEWLCAEAHAYAVRTGHLPAVRRAA